MRATLRELPRGSYHFEDYLESDQPEGGWLPIRVAVTIAGGGATVVGVPETKSIRPFVSSTQDSKRGTYVVMLDGSVRFIGESISDEVFKALCTIRGGESIEDIESIAPKAKLPKGPELKTTAKAE